MGIYSSNTFTSVDEKDVRLINCTVTSNYTFNKQTL